MSEEASAELRVICRVPGGFEALVALLIDGGVLAALSEARGHRHVGLMYWNGRSWTRVKSIGSKAGLRHLASAVEGAQTPGNVDGLTLVVWGDGHPFFDPRGDEAWVQVYSGTDGLERVKVFSSGPLSAPHALAFLAALAPHVTWVAGGGWSPAGFPSWATPRWWIRPEPTQIAGPLWMVIATPEVHAKLLSSERARRLAVGFEQFDDGSSVWQLSPEPQGPSGVQLVEWWSVLEDLGLVQREEG